MGRKRVRGLMATTQAAIWQPEPEMITANIHTAAHLREGIKQAEMEAPSVLAVCHTLSESQQYYYFFFIFLAYPAFMLLPIGIFGLWIWGSHRSETSLGVSMAAWSGLYVVKMYTHILPFHYGLIGDFLILCALAVAMQWAYILLVERDD